MNPNFQFLWNPPNCYKRWKGHRILSPSIFIPFTDLWLGTWHLNLDLCFGPSHFHIHWIKPNLQQKYIILMVSTSMTMYLYMPTIVGFLSEWLDYGYWLIICQGFCDRLYFSKYDIIDVFLLGTVSILIKGNFITNHLVKQIGHSV